MDDFERRKKLVIKVKYLEKCQYFKKILWKIFFMDTQTPRTLAKISHNTFAYYFFFRTFQAFFFEKKICVFRGMEGGGWPPSP